MTIDKGTIVVRTGPQNGRRSEQAEGALFTTVRKSENNRAFYTDSMSVSENNFRLAFSKEITLYKEGFKNINDFPFQYKDFCVLINYDTFKFKEYKQLCEDNNILYNKYWTGSGTYYGIKSDKWRGGVDSWGAKFTLEEFKKELLTIKINNKQDEKSRTITTKQGRKNKGTAITSNKKRQIAIASRLSGNRISARISRTRIIKSEISFGAITY